MAENSQITDTKRCEKWKRFCLEETIFFLVNFTNFRGNVSTYIFCWLHYYYISFWKVVCIINHFHFDHFFTLSTNCHPPCCVIFQAEYEGALTLCAHSQETRWTFETAAHFHIASFPATAPLHPVNGQTPNLQQQQ